MLGCHVTKADNYIHASRLRSCGRGTPRRRFDAAATQEEFDHLKRLIREEGRVKSFELLDKLHKLRAPDEILRETAVGLLGDDESQWPTYLNTGVLRSQVSPSTCLTEYVACCSRLLLMIRMKSTR